MINLDHNSTTPVHPDVVRAIRDALLARHGNASSTHGLGRAARNVLDTTRQRIAHLLGARTTGMHCDRVILTSGGTEANNLALFGIGGSAPGRIIVSAVEHPSVLEAADELARRGFELCRLPVGSDGVIDVAACAALINSDTRLVSLMLANNETGALQPVQQVAALCAERNVPIHTDAVQAVGKIPVEFRALQVTALTLSAHKFHGPRGIGALLIRSGQTIAPQLFGGHQQDGQRPGTEPIELAIGMCRALEIAAQEGGTRQTRMLALRDRYEELLRDANIGVIVNALDAQRLPHTSNVAFPGIDCQALHMALDMAGVACSVGSACASGAARPSHVLVAMQLPQEIVDASLRFSLGAFTTRQDIDNAVDRIVAVVRRLHAQVGSRRPN